MFSLFFCGLVSFRAQGNTQQDAASLILEAAAESMPLQLALQSKKSTAREIPYYFH